MTMMTVDSAAAAEPIERSALTAAAGMLRSLGDPTRLTIVQRLALGSTGSSMSAHLGLAQSTVSAHLACLKDCGLIDSRPVGRTSVDSLGRRDVDSSTPGHESQLLP